MKIEVKDESYVILQNEIVPRLKKCNMKPFDFCPPNIAAVLTRWELDGKFTRRDTRKFLDLVLENRSTN